MSTCFFATDLHGHTDRYDRLLAAIVKERPAAVFLGGDLLPHGLFVASGSSLVSAGFLDDYLVPAFGRLRASLGAAYPDIFLILGNDDPRSWEEDFEAASTQGLWHYAHGRKLASADHAIYGYACVPPTPFLLKDWERYDVSRYVPPGSVSPEDGRRSLAVEESRIRWGTIRQDLEALVGEDSLARAVVLFHTPPSDTPLDRAALDGMTCEHVPLDLHVGSIAVRRLIEDRQPLLTLHGHVHESTRLTGEWKIRLGQTVCINGAHDGPELALVRFDLESPWEATRELL
ncbi:MAG TPA: metallophosphoesterase [Terriglobales bacterium]|nr:metallophosphoesterase [Terriglobales bacterium]